MSTGSFLGPAESLQPQDHRRHITGRPALEHRTWRSASTTSASCAVEPAERCGGICALCTAGAPAPTATAWHIPAMHDRRVQEPARDRCDGAVLSCLAPFAPERARRELF
jgi:hypothetical protein